jgi:hypothetical protein
MLSLIRKILSLFRRKKLPPKQKLPPIPGHVVQSMMNESSGYTAKYGHLAKKKEERK